MGVGRALPARLAHLQGPRVGLASSPRGCRQDRETRGPTRDGFVAPRTPPASFVPPRENTNTHVLRGSGGSILMGPWNGAFANLRGSSSAASSTGDAEEASRSAPARRDSPSETRRLETRAGGDARERSDAVCAIDAEHLAELAFCGTDELQLDEGRAVAAELVSEDAITGRRDARSETREAGDWNASEWRSDGPDGTARGRNRRVSSAPAASMESRRVGAARVASRRRPSASFVKARRESFRAVRGETAGRQPSGEYGAGAGSRKNGGARNAMNTRITRPRGGGIHP